jgi:GNAT superfamily N-acetyltransferase
MNSSFLTRSGLDITELESLQGAVAVEALALYYEAFPIEEQETLKELESTVLHPVGDSFQHHFWAVTKHDQVEAIAVFSSYTRPRMGYLRFLAVRADLRGGGIGSRLLHDATYQVHEDGIVATGSPYLGLCLEVERPETALTPEETEKRERRIRFYERNGAFPVPAINLIAPPVTPGQPPVPYHLLFLPTPACPLRLTAVLQRQMAETVLVEGYATSLNDPYYRNSIATLLAAA